MTIKIQGANSTAAPGITGGDTDTGVQFGTNEVSLVTGGSERVKVDSSGSVGVGFSPELATLEVQGQNVYGSSAGSLATAASKAAFRVKGSTNSSDSLWMGVESSNATPYIQGANGIGSATKTLLLNPYGGNVGINITSPQYKLDIDGGNVRFNRGNSAGDILTLRGQNTEKAKFDTDGLKFNGDTATANALDDYEEGTWTPIHHANFGTISAGEGVYVKCGRMVFASFYFTAASVNTTTDNAIKGLPFTIADVHTQTGIESTAVAFHDNRMYLLYAQGGSNQLWFCTSRPVEGSTNTGSQNIRGSIVYNANA